MKQMYAVGRWSNAATTETPAPGKAIQWPTVKGSTSGVSSDVLHAILPHTLYSAPPARTADSDRPLPTRLALLNSSSGRVLIHAAPRGEDYVSHTLLNMPESADAQLAIQTWGSQHWQREAPEGSGDLPDLPYLPVAETLDDASLKTWLETPYKRELLEFALSALLSSENSKPIILAASSEDVARTVYAITRALPAGLAESLTFSTYEADPLNCTAKIIGHDTGSAERDLPEACYRQAITLNTFTGKRTDLTTEVPFAAYAVKGLADGDYTGLDDLKSTWQRLGLKDAKQFDLVFRLARGTGTLTKQEATEALQHPPLAAWISARTDALHQFLEWALDDRSFANASFVRAVQSLRQKPDVLAKLTERIKDAGQQAVKAGQTDRAANALEVLLPMAAPTKANAVWAELTNQMSQPNTLSWEMRSYLLPRFVRAKHPGTASTIDPGLARWLDVPVDQLANLLALDLPKAYHLEAARANLHRDGEPTATLTNILAQHPTLVLTLLQANTKEAEDRALTLFESLQSEAPAKPWFEDVIAKAKDYSPALLNRFFESTLAANKLDADRLVRTQGNRLLELFANQSGLDRLGTQFLATPPADVLNNTQLLGFFTQLKDHTSLSDGLKERITALHTVRGYLDDVRFDAESAKGMAAAFAVTPTPMPGTAKGDAFTAVVNELNRRSDKPDFQAELEAAMLHLGSTLATSPTDFYENTLRELRTKRADFGKQERTVVAVLAVALGAVQTPELVDNVDGLDGQAFAVASDAAKRGGVKLLDAINVVSKSWSKEAQTKWGFLQAAVRPRNHWPRDLGAAGIGFAIAAVLAVVWKFLL